VCGKRDRVLGFLHERGWAGRPLILFTDHLDDMPLIRESSIVCWFGSPEVLAIADATAPGTRLVFCRDLSPDRLCAIMQTVGVYPTLADREADRVREITAS
jgi:hypothetical protein